MDGFPVLSCTQFSPRSCSVRRFTNRGAFGFAVSQGTDAVQHLTGFNNLFPRPKNPKLQMVMPQYDYNLKMRISPLVEIINLRFHVSFGWGT